MWLGSYATGDVDGRDVGWSRAESYSEGLRGTSSENDLSPHRDRKGGGDEEDGPDGGGDPAVDREVSRYDTNPNRDRFKEAEYYARALSAHEAGRCDGAAAALAAEPSNTAGNAKSKAKAKGSRRPRKPLVPDAYPQEAM
jgi:hypothetical protein